MEHMVGKIVRSKVLPIMQGKVVQVLADRGLIMIQLRGGNCIYGHYEFWEVVSSE